MYGFCTEFVNFALTKLQDDFVRMYAFCTISSSWISLLFSTKSIKKNHEIYLRFPSKWAGYSQRRYFFLHLHDILQVDVVLVSRHVVHKRFPVVPVQLSSGSWYWVVGWSEK